MWLGPVSEVTTLFSMDLGVVVPQFGVKGSYIFGIVNLICTVSNLLLCKPYRQQTLFSLSAGYLSCFGDLICCWNHLSAKNIRPKLERKLWLSYYVYHVVYSSIAQTLSNVYMEVLLSA